MVIRIEINFFDLKIVIGQQTGKILHGIIEYMDGNSQYHQCSANKTALTLFVFGTPTNNFPCGFRIL